MVVEKGEQMTDADFWAYMQLQGHVDCVCPICRRLRVLEDGVKRERARIVAQVRELASSAWPEYQQILLRIAADAVEKEANHG
jgi:hypothetical protein